MDTILLVVALIYAVSTACLIAIGAGYQLQRWRRDRRDHRLDVVEQDHKGESARVTPNRSAF